MAVATQAEKDAAKVAAAFAKTPAGKIVALTGVSADQVAALVASHSGQGVADAKRSIAGPGEWVGGIVLGSYTDVYNVDGSLKTFPTAATKDMDAANQKTAGRYVADENGNEFKCYKKFLGLLLSESVEGLETLSIDGVELMFLNGATFGIKASEDTTQAKQEYQGTSRHPLKHVAYVA